MERFQQAADQLAERLRERERIATASKRPSPYARRLGAAAAVPGISESFSADFRERLAADDPVRGLGGPLRRRDSAADREALAAIHEAALSVARAPAGNAR
jgi:hypothetical protein